MYPPIRCISEDTSPNMQWFAVSTMPRHEKRVSEQMAEREIENFLPVYKAERQWKKRAPVVLELPLFPTYIFVRVGASKRNLVRSTPGVISIVGNGKEPLSVPCKEIESLRAGLKLYRAEPHPALAVGDPVRIQSGPLAGLEGVLVSKKNGFRVVLSISVIQRSISVEVDISHLIPIPIPAPSELFEVAV